MEGSVRLMVEEVDRVDARESLDAAADRIGPRAVWAAVKDQPPLPPELAAERMSLVEGAYGPLEES